MVSYIPFYRTVFICFTRAGYVYTWATAVGQQNTQLSGYGYYMFDQLVGGVLGDDWDYVTTTRKHEWSNTCLLHLHAVSNATDWFTTKLGFELYAYIAPPFATMDKTAYIQRYKTYLASAEGILHWNYNGPIVNSLKIESGLFPHTINTQVKTLGNYLFRSTIHPVSVQNKVDYPWADLLGGVADIEFFENRVKVEAIIASEFNYVPFFDFTPALGLFYKPNEVINIGGAIAFHHALQANIGLMPDSLGTKWQGKKLDFRAIFDPKPLVGGMDFLGKDELKIYGELAFLGLKDSLEVDTSNLSSLRSMDTTELNTLVFPANSLLHRMPFMVGINLPTWKALDLLAIELEWFYSPYTNDWLGKFENQKAEAKRPTSLKQWEHYIKHDNFKWAINIRKSVDKFEFRSFFGSDHTIYKLFNMAIGNFEQTMKRKGDWHWFVELRYNL